MCFLSISYIHIVSHAHRHTHTNCTAAFIYASSLFIYLYYHFSRSFIFVFCCRRCQYYYFFITSYLILFYVSSFCVMSLHLRLLNRYYIHIIYILYIHSCLCPRVGHLCSLQNDFYMKPVSLSLLSSTASFEYLLWKWVNVCLKLQFVEKERNFMFEFVYIWNTCANCDAICIFQMVNDMSTANHKYLMFFPLLKRK